VAIAAPARAAPPLALQDHPLAGRVWDVAARRFIPTGEAEARIASADLALLGETHDNADHHRIQARLVGQALDAGRRPALAFEQLDAEAQEAIDAARASGATPAAIGAAAGLARGWEWPLYEPLVALALARGLPLVALNLSRERARAIGRGGFESLGAGETARLALEGPWSAGQARALRSALVEGHCGEDGPRIDAMARMQRARDAVMADRLLAAGERGAMAILGRGHARADIGVPAYLRARAPGRRVVSLGLVEVVAGASEPEGYEEAAAGRHDLLWFTARAQRPDPCAGFGLPAAPGAAK